MLRDEYFTQGKNILITICSYETEDQFLKNMGKYGVLQIL
jgi:hypothetical protein